MIVYSYNSRRLLLQSSFNVRAGFSRDSIIPTFCYSVLLGDFSSDTVWKRGDEFITGNLKHKIMTYMRKRGNKSGIAVTKA